MIQFSYFLNLALYTLILIKKQNKIKNCNMQLDS